jgi:drug/metabolite transporter (DMT)-like permease
VTAGALVGGMALAAAAAACYDGGYVLQTLEARRAPAAYALRPLLLAHLVRQRVWLGATLLALAGWPLQVVALRLAPLTVVQPTLSLGLLLLLALGTRMLREPVGPREVGAVLAIGAGMAAIAWAAPDRSAAQAGTPGLVAALGGLGVLTLGPYLGRALGRGRGLARREHPLSRRAAWAMLVSAGAADAWAALATKLVAYELGRGRWGIALAWSLGAGATFGVGLLSEMTALQRLGATRVGPTVLAMQMALPVLLAPVLFGESWGRTPLGGGAIVVGLAAVVAGGAALSASRPLSRLAEETA